MTSRKDIENGRLIYTEDLGWIDLGHAKGDDSKMLWNQLITEGNDSPYKKGYFLVYYFQEMSKYNISTRVAAQWMVKKGLSIETKRSIAFSIMYCVSLEFETLQSNSFFSRFSDSGFSCEDLVSNLLGFYKSVLPRDYMSLIKPKIKNMHIKYGIIMVPLVSIRIENLNLGFFLILISILITLSHIRKASLITWI